MILLSQFYLAILYYRPVLHLVGKPYLWVLNILVFILLCHFSGYLTIMEHIILNKDYSSSQDRWVNLDLTTFRHHLISASTTLFFSRTAVINNCMGWLLRVENFFFLTESFVTSSLTLKFFQMTKKVPNNCNECF